MLVNHGYTKRLYIPWCVPSFLQHLIKKYSIRGEVNFSQPLHCRADEDRTFLLRECECFMHSQNNCQSFGAPESFLRCSMMCFLSTCLDLRACTRRSNGFVCDFFASTLEMQCLSRSQLCSCFGDTFPLAQSTPLKKCHRHPNFHLLHLCFVYFHSVFIFKEAVSCCQPVFVRLLKFRKKFPYGDYTYF